MKTHPLIELQRTSRDYCYLHKETPCNCVQLGRLTPDQARVVMEDWLREWLDDKASKMKKTLFTRKLTPAVLIDIRRRLALGETHPHISRELNLCLRTIGRVVRYTDAEIMLSFYEMQTT